MSVQIDETVQTQTMLLRMGMYLKDTNKSNHIKSNVIECITLANDGWEEITDRCVYVLFSAAEATYSLLS